MKDHHRSFRERLQKPLTSCVPEPHREVFEISLCSVYDLMGRGEIIGVTGFLLCEPELNPADFLNVHLLTLECATVIMLTSFLLF